MLETGRAPTPLPANQTGTLHAGGRSLTLPASNVNKIRFEQILCLVCFYEFHRCPFSRPRSFL